VQFLWQTLPPISLGTYPLVFEFLDSSFNSLSIYPLPLIHQEELLFTFFEYPNLEQQMLLVLKAQPIA